MPGDDPEKWERHLCPLITIDRTLFTQHGKQIAFAWIGWLCSGPDFDSFKRLMGCVRGIVF